MKVKVSFSVVSIGTINEKIDYTEEALEEAIKEAKKDVIEMIEDYFGSSEDIKSESQVNDFKIEIIENNEVKES
jgi:uncharacterized membrane-anchored protein